MLMYFLPKICIESSKSGDKSLTHPNKLQYVFLLGMNRTFGIVFLENI